ncbi:MAG: EAL domain-containing protein [Rhodospirillales bacterium]|nr:EAL domain-containing protein [Rhodospirillales bacterium]
MNDKTFQITPTEIDAALSAGELVYYYQPKVALHSGEIIGAEALLRWRRPDGTMIPPGDFLPMAEKTGMISNITNVMLPSLIADIEMLKAVSPAIQVALNVSAMDLASPYLNRMLRSYIAEKRIGIGNIQIEVTETALLEDSHQVQESLNTLVEMGIEVAMDDYGTGYSSLDMLSRFPFSTLKLDHGVIRRMAENAKNTHIVRASLVMARELSLKTVAEGIESKAAYVFLAASGCLEAQGFWISKAIPVDDFRAMVVSGRRWPACGIGLVHDAASRHSQYKRKLMDTVYTLMNTDPGEWDDIPRVDLVHSPAHSRLDRVFRGGSEHARDANRAMHEAGRGLVRAVKAQAGPEVIEPLIEAFTEASSVVDAELARGMRFWLSGSQFPEGDMPEVPFDGNED